MCCNTAIHAAASYLRRVTRSRRLIATGADRRRVGVDARLSSLALGVLIAIYFSIYACFFGVNISTICRDICLSWGDVIRHDMDARGKFAVIPSKVFKSGGAPVGTRLTGPLGTFFFFLLPAGGPNESEKRDCEYGYRPIWTYYRVQNVSLINERCARSARAKFRWGTIYRIVSRYLPGT